VIVTINLWLSDHCSLSEAPVVIQLSLSCAAYFSYSSILVGLLCTNVYYHECFFCVAAAHFVISIKISKTNDGHRSRSWKQVIGRLKEMGGRLEPKLHWIIRNINNVYFTFPEKSGGRRPPLRSHPTTPLIVPIVLQMQFPMYIYS